MRFGFGWASIISVRRIFGRTRLDQTFWKSRVGSGPARPAHLLPLIVRSVNMIAAFIEVKIEKKNIKNNIDKLKILKIFYDKILK